MSSTQEEHDLIISLLDECGPLSTFELREKLLQRFKIGGNATSKRLGRLLKKGKIRRHMRLERGAYIYHLSNHSPSELKQVARRLSKERSPLVGRILETLETGRVLCIYELGRLANTSYEAGDGEPNPRITILVNKLFELGVTLQGKYLMSPEVSEKSEINKLIAEYEAAIYEEAFFSVLTRNLFLNQRKARAMTVYRYPKPSSFAKHKFDLYGHGGWRNMINIVVEFNLRRKVTWADLKGFCQRVGGTVGRHLGKKAFTVPTARYYVALDFSPEAMKRAEEEDLRVRYLDATRILSGHLMEVHRSGRRRYKKSAGRFFWKRYRNLKGLAFEVAVEPVYGRDFKTKRNKKFFVRDGGQLTEDDTGKTLTDIDVYATREDGKCETLLIECKSGIEKLTRKELFSKTKKYLQVARFLRKQKNHEVKIVVIANVDKLHENELTVRADKVRLEMQFISPRKFYETNKEWLKGQPKWLFGF